MSEIFLCGGAADATVLSNVFIDEYLKDANDAQLKVYLFLVRRLQAGDPVSISDMADRFNHTEKDPLLLGKVRRPDAQAFARPHNPAADPSAPPFQGEETGRRTS